jgi:thiamine-phosphate pyrophosphorylase
VVPHLQYIANHSGGASRARTVDVVWRVLEAGVPAVQLRVKDATDAERLDLALEVVAACRAAGALCVINDRADIALAAGADGVHVGPEDIPAEAARRLIGPDLILGGSARSIGRARELEAGGVSYLGVGPCYASESKAGLPPPIGPDGVRMVADSVDVPVIAIGGVTAPRVPELWQAGARGVAVIGAIAAATDPAAAAKEFLDQIGALV